MKSLSKDLSKIVIVVLILLLLLSGIIFLRIKRRLPSKIEIGQKSAITAIAPTKGVGVNNIFLVASPSNLPVGSSIKIAVAFYAPGSKLSGADVILKYDPAYLSAAAPADLAPGEYFSSYPLKTVDNSKGTIRLTAFGGKNEAATSPMVIFSTTLNAKKAGKTEISIDYQPGTTNHSTLVERGTSKNILSGVNNAVVEIK